MINLSHWHRLMKSGFIEVEGERTDNELRNDEDCCLVQKIRSRRGREDGDDEDENSDDYADYDDDDNPECQSNSDNDADTNCLLYVPGTSRGTLSSTLWMSMHKNMFFFIIH